MATEISQFFQVFFEESAEHLATMERLLLGLNPDAPDMEDLNAIFRAAHSIKGGAGTFGFKDMTVVTHILESLLDRLRNHELALTQEMVDLFLVAGDAIGMQLSGHRDGSGVDQRLIDEVCRKLEALALGENVPVVSNSKGDKSLASPAGPIHYEINFAPKEETFRRGIRVELLMKELAALGKITVAADISGAPTFVELDPELCYLRWRIELETASPEAEIREIFEFVAADDELQIRIKALDPGYGLFEGAPGAPSQRRDQSQPLPENPFGRRAYERNELAPGAFGRRTIDLQESSIRVAVPKVDKIINQVGELVITQAMLAQTAADLDSHLFVKLHTALSQLERNTRDLQESVMSMRMVPMTYVFSRFPRLVRDTAAALGKQVELETIGETTELDKGLIEQIADPLTHLVRNCLDHGIEAPEVRRKVGKPLVGTITMSASQKEGKVVIEVADDGAGLNREKIMRKAKEQSLPVYDDMSDEELWQLIFHPGFSTADTITDVSGRGVGMDVVLRNVTAMGGKVQIKSEPGKGSRFTIRLPLTMAILDGLSVRVGQETFILPLNSIIESLQPCREEISTIKGTKQVVHVRGEYVPLMPLHEVFHVSGAVTEPEKGILTLAETEGEKVALLVDELLGQQQVVVKSLETNYRKVEGTSGATILGDGRVALILDVGSLVSLARAAA